MKRRRRRGIKGKSVAISRKEYERLRTFEERYRRIFDDNLIANVISDHSGQIHEANDAYLKITGFTRAEVSAGKANWKDVSSKEFRRREIKAGRELKEYGRCTPFEKTYIRKDGIEVPILIGFTRMREKVTCFIVDLTQQKKIEKQLKEAVRAREDFLSIASHELKTPLTSLFLQLQLLQRLAKSGSAIPVSHASVDKKLDSIQRQLKRLYALIDSLLDVTRIRANRLTWTPGRMELRSLLEEIVLRFQDEAGAKGTRIILQKSLRAEGYWDRTRIEQVISNLISNALKYGNGHPVTVLMEVNQNQAILRVRDQGIGISKRDQARIFDRFERAAGHNYGGLGLGLYITKSYVERHGGRISLESELGKGSTFTVELPIQFPLNPSPPE